MILPHGPPTEALETRRVGDEDRHADGHRVREAEATGERDAIASLEHPLRDIQQGLELFLGGLPVLREHGRVGATTFVAPCQGY